MPTLFIIAGCNGAGKTTASFTALPELLNIKEFVNADEIARGLSPFQPETVAIEAGRIMLARIEELVLEKRDFAFETTLATRSFADLCERARMRGYEICLVFLWLDSAELAIERVKQRVSEGGHNVPEETIIRRYHAGIENFFTLYQDKLDYWMFIDNSWVNQDLVAECKLGESVTVYNQSKWEKIKSSRQ